MTPYKYQLDAMSSSGTDTSPRVGNLSQVAGQKQILQGTVGRTNFPPTLPFPLLSLNLGNLWNFNQIN